MSPIEFFNRTNTENDAVIREVWSSIRSYGSGFGNIIFYRSSYHGSYLNKMTEAIENLEEPVDLIVLDTIQSVSGLHFDKRDKDDDRKTTL